MSRFDVFLQIHIKRDNNYLFNLNNSQIFLLHKFINEFVLKSIFLFSIQQYVLFPLKINESDSQKLRAGMYFERISDSNKLNHYALQVHRFG